MKYVMYDKNGKITQHGEMPEYAINIQNCYGILVSDLQNPDLYYVDVTKKEVKERTENPALLDGLILSSLPIPCLISINNKSYECNEDHAELDLPSGLSYEIIISRFPMKDKKFEITT